MPALKILVAHEGKTQGLSEWARETGIHRHTLYIRWRRGMRGDRLFRPDSLIHDPWHATSLLTFNGETMSTPNWGDRYGIGGEVIRSRLGRGWTTEEAITTPLGESPERVQRLRKSANMITVDDETLNRTQWGKTKGFNRGTIPNRLLRGWSIEEALNKPKSKQGRPLGPSKSIEYDGKNLTQAAWARELGCSPAAFSVRLKKGWSMEKITTTPFSTTGPKKGSKNKPRAQIA